MTPRRRRSNRKARARRVGTARWVAAQRNALQTQTRLEREASEARSEYRANPSFATAIALEMAETMLCLHKSLLSFTGILLLIFLLDLEASLSCLLQFYPKKKALYASATVAEGLWPPGLASVRHAAATILSRTLRPSGQRGSTKSLPTPMVLISRSILFDMAPVITGEWATLDDVLTGFDNDYSSSPIDLEGREIVYACYERESYEGSCFVLLKDPSGDYYEASSSHCSCNGLSWSPERTNLAALLTQPRCRDYHGLYDLVKALVREQSLKDADAMIASWRSEPFDET